MISISRKQNKVSDLLTLNIKNCSVSVSYTHLDVYKRQELISGHRRKKACELAGLETLKCEVKELTRDEAIIVMVESRCV